MSVIKGTVLTEVCCETAIWKVMVRPFVGTQACTKTYDGQ